MFDYSVTFQDSFKWLHRVSFLKTLTAFVPEIVALQTVKTHFIYNLKSKRVLLLLKVTEYLRNWDDNLCSCL